MQDAPALVTDSATGQSPFLCQGSTVGWGEARTPTGFGKYTGWHVNRWGS